MSPSSRRRLDVALLITAAVLVAGAALAGALGGDTERVGNYWTHATINADGTAEVIEVIDYDFGPRSRRGILRDILDVDVNAGFLVSSPTAPDQFTVSNRSNGVQLRIGDPDITISGRHRYNIAYPIDTLTVGDRVAWNAVGLSWDHPINNLEAHVTARREFSDLVCNRGSLGDRGGCDVSQIAPGHLLVEATGLDAGEAVTIEGTLGAPFNSIQQQPVMPIGAATDPGSGWKLPTIASLLPALLAGAAMSRYVRHLGREKVWVGGAADAAFGPTGGAVFGHRLVDHEQLDEMATIEFASPKGLSAAAGGIIHAEGVRPEHQIAWLIECAIRDEIILDESDLDLALVRGPAEPHVAVAARLDKMFAGAKRIELGKFDEHFASSWSDLGTELEEWREGSGLWDPLGHKRRTTARVVGFLAGLGGLALVVLGAIAANRSGSSWVGLCVFGALIAGSGFAAMIRSWELPIRSPEGSGYWLQIESFRRFIAGSEAQHAEAAARFGLLRQYTAWAVALGELDHWKESVDAAAAIPGSAALNARADYHFVGLAPVLSSSTAQTFTAPSSSGGGGGGGGAGGGGGGGGGGSW